MKLFVFALLSLFLVVGCVQEGIDQKCTDLVVAANEYCSQFTLGNCENQSFEHTSNNILPSPIDCRWDSAQSSCVQTQGCD